MAGNIIPAIATTNAMTASICVLQAFKVMRNELNKAKMVFLAPNGTERRLTTEALSPPNPTCPVCSVAQSTLLVDANRATLNDLVESVLRLRLGYGEEFSINSEAGLLYDPEEDTNLQKTFTDLGLKNDTSITIIDDADEDAKVNLVLHISEQSLDAEAKPIDLAQNPDIPLKPKVASPTATNEDAQPVVTNGLTNGVTNDATSGLKRTADQAGLEDELIKKKGKVVAKPDDDVVLVDDANDGIILIDD
jgi:ubiquitin-like 1-activating enzyme E1 B